MAPLVELAAVAFLISTRAVAAPWNPVVRYTTHHSRPVGPNGVKASVYQRESTFETYGVDGRENPLSKRASKATPEAAARSFLESTLENLSPDGLARRSGHTDNRTRVSNEYFRQQFNGLQVANAVANVAPKDGKVLSFGASFIKSKSIASATPTFPKQNAIAKAEVLTGAKYNSFPVGLEYLAKDNDQVVLTHTVQVQNDATMESYLVYVDASNGEVVNVVDFTAKASYRVIPFTSQDPRDGLDAIADPHDPVSSPNGEVSSESSATNNYDYVCNPAAEPTVSSNADVARVNAFYIVNMFHDLTAIASISPFRTRFSRTMRLLLHSQTDNPKNATDRDFILGSYINTTSIRSYPYSTNRTTNPRTYESLNGLESDEEHFIGEIWALNWHEVYAALIEKYGFTIEKNNPGSTAGNIVALHLFIDAMKLQPCNPTFISTRDAVIQADANGYNGANKCLLWTAYAKRGLGYGATTAKVDSNTIPPEC
ncbi:hypothetical protein RSAG8_05704, partial [Rhizoctonia solani AG-8 WAC10335]